jgi:hypothetical protein
MRELPTAVEHIALDRRLEFKSLLFEGQPITIDEVDQDEVDQDEVDQDEVEGRVKAFEGFVDLEFKHCTILESGITVRLNPSDAPALRVQIEHSMVGFLRLPTGALELVVRDSIIDSGQEQLAISGARPGKPGPATTLARVTILGDTWISELRLASDVIFARPVIVERPDTGLIREHAPGVTRGGDGGIKVQPGDSVPLENGIMIRFEGNGEYRPGDYWLIPARSEAGGYTILWPTEPAPEPQPDGSGARRAAPSPVPGQQPHASCAGRSPPGLGRPGSGRVKRQRRFALDRSARHCTSNYILRASDSIN